MKSAYLLAAVLPVFAACAALERMIVSEIMVEYFANKLIQDGSTAMVLRKTQLQAVTYRLSQMNVRNPRSVPLRP
jgi:hypothetical protein